MATDVQNDVAAALDVVGWPNSDFYYYWTHYVSGGLPWDGESCSEIACCISYFGGNLSKIYVSNYAEGMYNLYLANNRFGHTPSLGAFIWFDYGAGVPEHTGRVVAIDNNAGTITTVEGNVYNYVAEFTYSINDPTIFGYGYPNYTDQPTPPPTPPTPGGNQGTYDRKRRRRHNLFY